MSNTTNTADNLITHESVPFEDAVEFTRGSWYIRLGFAGFNSRANNGDGYTTKDAAMRAVRRYQQA